MKTIKAVPKRVAIKYYRDDDGTLYRIVRPTVDDAYVEVEDKKGDFDAIDSDEIAARVFMKAFLHLTDLVEMFQYNLAELKCDNLRKR